MEKLVYNGRDGGIRLDAFILQRMPGLGPGILHKYLRQNKIKLNGKKQPLSTRLTAGDEVFLYLPPNTLAAPPPLDIVFEDDNLLAINKPAGLASMSRNEAVDWGDTRTALAAIRRHLGAAKLADNTEADENPQADKFIPVLCHRLDTGTSGVLLAAKTQEGEAFVLDLIKSHRLEKEYLCVTTGHPAPPAGKLTGWLTKDARAARVMVRSTRQKGAREAELTYTTLATSGPLALVQVQLVTGRTHQIRAQFAAAGTPLLGDSKYGKETENRRWKCKYQCLCAKALRFPAHIGDAHFAKYSGLVLECKAPWFVEALQTGKLGGDA